MCCVAREDAIVKSFFDSRFVGDGAPDALHELMQNTPVDIHTWLWRGISATFLGGYTKEFLADVVLRVELFEFGINFGLFENVVPWL